MKQALASVSYGRDEFKPHISRAALDAHYGKHHAACAVAQVTSHSPRQNDILGALPAEDYERLLPHLELQPLELGYAIYEAGDHMDFGYFPTTSIVSPLCIMEDGTSAAIAIAGKEGVVGFPLFMGGGTSPNRSVVQSAGHAYRLSASTLKREFDHGGPLQHLLLRYAQALIMQIAQTAMCNQHHTVEQRLSRWLLLSLDRVSSNELKMTQELLAHLLGVRRESVTAVAGKLQEAGLISYRRGRITILDRPALEARVCECYAVVNQEFKRLLPNRVAN
jgi:CRP-like cAMP-binding protein